MTLKDALDELRGRAGAPKSECRVYFAEWEGQKPKLIHVPARKEKGTKWHWRKRHVIVGKEWLRQRAPKLWAAICAARLTKENAQLVPKLLTKEDTR